MLIELNRFLTRSEIERSQCVTIRFHGGTESLVPRLSSTGLWLRLRSAQNDPALALL